jgi:hypothetical protein
MTKAAGRATCRSNRSSSQPACGRAAAGYGATVDYFSIFVRRWLLPALLIAAVVLALQAMAEASVVALGGSLMIGVGVVLALNLGGTADALWRFWEARYAQFGMRARANPLFVRLWFAGLLILIGAAWIFSA